MPTAVEFRYDSDQITDMAHRFQAQADKVDMTLRDIQGKLENLRMGGWVGVGADRFYMEMDQVFTPNLDRMIQMFQALSAETERIADQVLQAEERMNTALANMPSYRKGG